MHEVMEQQTVTIAKAGIHASLNSRCSVVAAANPSKHLNCYKNEGIEVFRMHWSRGKPVIVKGICDASAMAILRGDVAKSQLFQAITNIAPLAISTTCRGSFGVGLTAAVTTEQDKGEAGVMVLVDRGVVCIDEFDGRTVHEVMEQTVTIAKAVIHASFNSRCSVVAAANPIYGTYDRSLKKNIGLPDTLLHCFDKLIVLDQMYAGIDRQISEHVLRMHHFRSVADGGHQRDDEENGSSVLYGKKSDRGRTINYLEKYAKNRIQPELTDEASEHIATAYTELRNASSNVKTGGTLPITARTLETIIRLPIAHTKLKKQVLKIDAEAALQALNFAIYHQELSEMDEHGWEKERERRA